MVNEFTFYIEGHPRVKMPLHTDKTIKGDSISENINHIDLNVLTKVENDLEPQDLISIVFLLYDEPHVALQKSKLYSTISQSTRRLNTNLLLHWAESVHSTNPMWKYQLLEALAVCQLYSNIRKLNFDVSDVKRHFLPTNVYLNLYINPVRKVLYRICEELTNSDFEKLKSCLETFDLDCKGCSCSEILFLHLICHQFISFSQKTTLNQDQNCNLNDLIDILKSIGRVDLSQNLSDFQTHIKSHILKSSSEHDQNEDVNISQLESQFHMLHVNKETVKFKKDSEKLPVDSYPIFDQSDKGICLIINQVKFKPSQESILQNIETLSDRTGSDKDRDILHETFSKFGFTVIIYENLTHDKIKKIILSAASKVKKTHSAFILCVLSHGIEGAVFGTDSIPVKVMDIQDILYCNIVGRPKLVVIQACQGSKDAKAVRKLVEDGPVALPHKSDLVTYWATVRGYSSYRDEEEGTIFIQLLCQFLNKYANHNHLLDIFTKVNGFIMEKMASHKNSDGEVKVQIPIFDSTLRKKFYLI